MEYSTVDVGILSRKVATKDTIVAVDESIDYELEQSMVEQGLAAIRCIVANRVQDM